MNKANISPMARTRFPIMSPILSFKMYEVVKRGIDLCAALVGLILLLPLFIGIACLIRRNSPGPVFYRATRVGKDGRKFGMLKFRTMEQWHDPRRLAKVTAEDDPRVTPLGRRLRATKINELPQLWNVLKGEMSLVGPRPEDPEIVKTWPEAVRCEVLSVRPGITSPASVLFRDEESLLSRGNVMRAYLESVLPTKLRLDQLYVRHRSWGLDFDILLWTALVLIPRLRLFVPVEGSIFLGPISLFARRYLNWFIADTLITLVAIGLSGIVWRSIGPLDIGWLPALEIGIGFSLLFSLTGAFLGINRIAWAHAWASDAMGLVVSAITAGLIALLANQAAIGTPLLPPNMIVSASFLALIGFVTARYRSRLISGFISRWLARVGSVPGVQERVLIIGGGQTGQFVAWLLSDGNNAGIFHVAGFVDDDHYKQGTRYYGINVIGRRVDIPRLVAKHDIGIIVFAIHNIGSVERHALLEICGSTPARVVAVPDIVATLNTAIAEKVKGGDGLEAPPERRGGETRLFESEGIPPVQAQLWLSELDRAAKSGDLAAVGDQILAIREEIQKFAV